MSKLEGIRERRGGHVGFRLPRQWALLIFTEWLFILFLFLCSLLFLSLWPSLFLFRQPATKVVEDYFLWFCQCPCIIITLWRDQRAYILSHLRITLNIKFRRKTIIKVLQHYYIYRVSHFLWKLSNLIFFNEIPCI